MQRAIALLDEDWAADQDSRRAIAEELGKYLSDQDIAHDLDSIELIQRNWSEDQARAFSAWIRLLPNARVHDEGYQKKINESSARYFSVWRQNTPATVARNRKAAPLLANPFSRGFSLIPGLDDGGPCPLGTGFGKCASDTAKWDLIAHYAVDDKVIEPYDFGTEIGPRGVRILAWFEEMFSPRAADRATEHHDKPYNVTVVVEQSLLGGLQPLIGKHGRHEVKVAGGTSNLQSRVIVTFESINADELTREKLLKDIKPTKIFVFSEQTAAEATKLLAPSAPVSIRPMNSPRPPEPCFRIVVAPNPEANAGQVRKVAVKNGEIVSPDNPLIVWDCIWEAIFLETRITRAA